MSAAAGLSAERFQAAVEFIAKYPRPARRIYASALEVGDLIVSTQRDGDQITIREVTHRRVSDHLILIRYENALGISKGDTSFHTTSPITVLR